jgi:nickel/cobalt exporter
MTVISTGRVQTGRLDTRAPRLGKRGRWSIVVCAIAMILMAGAAAAAHPLGNFTVNHFIRLEVAPSLLHVRFVVDMAEVATLQELQAAGATDPSAPTDSELQAYLDRAATEYAAGLIISIDGTRVIVHPVATAVSTPEGAAGLKTLRVECDMASDLPPAAPGVARRIHLEDANHRGRIGWHELVVSSDSGLVIFDSSAFGNAVTDELRAYPQDSLAAPLDERSGEFSYALGAIPAGGKPLITRQGSRTAQARDRLAELIAVPRVTPMVALFGLLIAAALGGLHALSPGHGKTIVGAYLVGARGTPRHAAFLGLTVTATHTAGVFALGLVTLVASRYVLPERLFPLLSFASGVIVVVMGATLFFRRLRAALSRPAAGFVGTQRPHADSHRHGHTHDEHHLHSDPHHHGAPHFHEDGQLDHHHSHNHDHGHSDQGGAVTHSHGGSVHTHLPPGANGSRVTWRSLLALGISGGLLPCPSALVVLLGSISLHRVGYGLILVAAFSAGLASVLTAIGLLFVYAGRFMKSAIGAGRLARVIPVLSALVIAGAGLVICWQSLGQAVSGIFHGV